MPAIYLATDAHFSDDMVHRYSLTRRLGLGSRIVVFAGLNPSTATKDVDDPTVRREVGFSRAWGFDWYYKVNVNSFRSTDPRLLPDDVERASGGAVNRLAIVRLVDLADLVVAAWGQNKLNTKAATNAAWILMQPKTRCLGQNQDGTPRHPLYLPKSTTLVIPQ